MQGFRNFKDQIGNDHSQPKTAPFQSGAVRHLRLTECPPAKKETKA